MLLPLDSISFTKLLSSSFVSYLLSQLSFELQLAGLWEEKLKEEQVKTGPLEEVCAALREALDAETKKRMEAFENKMKPIIIKDGPSRKVSSISYIVGKRECWYKLKTFNRHFFQILSLCSQHFLLKENKWTKSKVETSISNFSNYSF